MAYLEHKMTIINYVYTSPLTFQSPFTMIGIFLLPAFEAAGPDSILFSTRDLGL